MALGCKRVGIYGDSAMFGFGTFRAGLHYGAWEMTFFNGLSSWANFHGPTS